MIAIEAAESRLEMGENEMFGEFDEAKIEEYKEEFRRKYGSEKLDESVRKTAKYTKADWDEVKAEAKEINVAIAIAYGP